MDPVGIRARDRRLEIRTTGEDGQRIDRAVAAQQVLADREEFRLDPEALEAWERINQRPARSLKGLRALMDRPSPYPCWHQQGVRGHRNRKVRCAGVRRLVLGQPQPSARAFYLHLIPKFESFPTDPLHLVLLMKDLLRTLG